MKTIIRLFVVCLFACCGLRAQESEQPFLLIPWAKAPQDVPLFFSAEAQVEARVGLASVTSEQKIRFRVLQGKPETLTLRLSGAGEVREVAGTGLRDWAVRKVDNGERFLDVRPGLENGKLPEASAGQLEIVVKTHLDVAQGQGSLLLPGSGGSAAFTISLNVVVDSGVRMKVLQAERLSPLNTDRGYSYVGADLATYQFSIEPAGADARGLELINAALTGTVSPDGEGMSFRFTATARSEAAGSAVRLLGGRAALADGVSGQGWHVALRKEGESWIYDLVADQAGEFPVDLSFVVATERSGDWRVAAFDLPGGVVVPVVIEGLDQGVEFDAGRDVVPEFVDGRWRGFVPASGKTAMAWHVADEVADGALFYSSTETTDVRIGSGLLRQATAMDLRVLQGKLSALSLALEGPGEVLSVAGGPVIGWSVEDSGEGRHLVVKLNRPIEGAERITVEAQVALDGFPVRTRGLRISPVGSLRHSGWLRVGNDGAVRIEVMDAKGLIQLAPDRFPGAVDPALLQVFVYRFPSAEYGYSVQANQVSPEVGVTEVTIYELAETDRRIYSDLELDIREAPLREWEIGIPAGYAVAGVSGAEVADYAVGAEVGQGRRLLKILFRQAVADRQLINLRLEKNEAAKAGAWDIQPLDFPGVKTRRGYVGVVAAAGYRVNVGKTSGTAEVPLTFFPKKTAGLQQAFRLREPSWSVALTVETLGQSIQADVFHLYSLKPGAVYGSVVMNFFVVGAPATEWRVAVPEGIGNVDVVGQNVGRDWRREGTTVIVPLSRPVLGAGTLLLSFEQPMNPGGGKISPGEVSPLGVQAERGFVQVVSPMQVKHESTSSGSLMAIDPSELPSEFRLLSSAATLAAWQYTSRDFEIAMNVEWFVPGETVEQLVDFLKLETRVSRDGEWVTDARMFVKSRGRGALRMVLPEKTSLWEVKVDGDVVNARVDGKDTLVPLPTRSNVNEAVEVALRYGARSERARRVGLAAPQLDVPVVVGEWIVTGDEGRQLLPRGGTADVVGPVLAESGFEWLARNPMWPLILLAVGGGAVWLGRVRLALWRRVSALVAGLCFIGVAWLMVPYAAIDTVAGSQVFEYAAPVVEADGVVAVEVANLPVWVARTGLGVWLCFLVGTAVAIRGLYRNDRWWLGCGLVLTLGAFLAVRGGAPWFFAAVGLTGIFWLWPRVIEIFRGLWRRRKVSPALAGTVLLLCAMGVLDRAQAADLPGLKPAEAMLHEWQLRDGRLYGTVQISVRGAVDDRFLLLREPAVLREFAGEGLRVGKTALADGNAYWVIAETGGLLQGKAIFEMPLPDPAAGWTLPGGPAALRRVSLRRDEPGWEFVSAEAAKIDPLDNPGEGESGAVLWLGPADPVKIQARPRQRDADTEETRYFAEVANLFVPGPGVVNGTHLVSVRPSQGRVTSLTMKVPEGFTVSDVVKGPVGSWRFDPGTHALRVVVEPAQEQAFSFTVETQRGTTELPVDLRLAPLRVDGAAGEVGSLALAFGEEVQPEAVQAEGASRVNAENFNHELLPLGPDGKFQATIQHAFRYGPGDVVVALKVAAVSPELRAELWQLLSLGEDRLVLATDLSVTITRSGVFRLELDVPEGLEIETITGEGLTHWTETGEGAKRVVSLHLAGKTMGRRDFNLTLAGRPTGARPEWMVPRISVRGASRETGVLTVVPEQGLQVRPVARKNVSQLDPRELASVERESARAAARAGALAFRLLQGDWSLAFAIDRLDPWVTARVLHESTIREGQLLTRLRVGYKIENAAVKVQRVRIPGLDAAAAATLRATGPAVADLVPVEGEEGTWEIRFQRGMAGDTEVELEYRQTGAEQGVEKIAPVAFENVRQLEYFVVLRAGGRLELEPGGVPRGWQRTDWSVVKSTLGTVAGQVVPVMAFRVAEPEGPLPVILRRHDLAGLRKLRVSEGQLTTLVSPHGDMLTAVLLKMRVAAKGTLRMRLPEGASLLNVFVNDEGAPLVRENEAWLFHVFPAADADQTTSVRFVYAAPMPDDERLEGPMLDVPMENLTWRVLIPQGWRLADHDGDFELKQQERVGRFRLEDYQSVSQSKQESGAENVVALLDRANAYMAAGDQEKAGLAFGQAVNQGQLDAASGEDARVQLRQLKTQQAVLGLNTRRQKLVLDNRLIAPQQAENAQLNRAVELNPVLRGDLNYDPKQFDRFLEGNTADENAALKEIANRIVAQQLAAEPAPTVLDVTLPELGTALDFSRSVQVDGDQPMAIELDLKRAGSGFSWLGVFLCLLAGSMGATRWCRPR